MYNQTERSFELRGPSPLFDRGFSVSARRVDDVIVIDTTGPFMGESGAHALNGLVQELLDEGERKFAINLAQVHDIDSAALGGLAAAYNRIEQAAGQITLFAATARVGRMLNRMHLDAVFEVFANEEAALKHLVKLCTKGQNQPQEVNDPCAGGLSTQLSLQRRSS